MHSASNNILHQQQLFYGTLIQDNLKQSGHINPRYHHYPPQYL